MNKKVDYEIDRGILHEVAKNTKKEGELDVGSLEIRYYEDDSLISETFTNNKVVPFWIMQEHTHDKITLNGLVGMFDAWGFHLQIEKTTFKVTYFAGADFGIYKKHKSDTALNAGIQLKCMQTSLTLSEYPKFEDNEKILGIVRFKTPEYWVVANGNEKKCRLEGKAYFSTKLTQNIPKALSTHP